MTTEERIAELERLSDHARDSALEWCDDEIDSSWFQAWASLAQVYELRALRLMLRDEIREAAWRLAAPAQPLPRPDDPSGHIPRPGWTGEQWEAVTSEGPIASRKAPPLEEKP